MLVEGFGGTISPNVISEGRESRTSAHIPGKPLVVVRK